MEQEQLKSENSSDSSELPNLHLRPGASGIPKKITVINPEENAQPEEEKQEIQVEEPSELIPKKKVKGVTVYARLRPLAVGVDRDQSFGPNYEKTVTVDESQQNIRFQEGMRTKKFKFDHIFLDQASQEHVFKHTTEVFVDKLFNGYNCAVLVYGQSGSGKTHTMLGDGYDNLYKQAPPSKEEQGLIPRFMDSMFYRIYQEPENDITYDIRASYIEIYQEQIRDLLFYQASNLNIYTEPNSGLMISNATQVPITSCQDVLNLIENGSKIRKTAKTNLNEHSSRSHAIVVVTIFIDNGKTGEKKASQLYMADLAGSENVGKAQTEGYSDEQIREAGKINTSLLTLGNVIQALIDKKKHIPYRSSKLTRLLQNAFGGNSYTSILLTLSQKKENYFQTLSTLQFGDRANKMENTPSSNVEFGEKQLRQMYEKACHKIMQQDIVIKDQRNEVNNLKKALRDMMQHIDPSTQSSMFLKHGKILSFLQSTDVYRSDRSGFLALQGNCFAYVFLFLHPMEIKPLFLVCKAFNQRLKSEYLWRHQLDQMKVNNKEFEYDQDQISRYFLFFRKISLQRFLAQKKANIQSKQQGNLSLFQGSNKK